MIALYRGTSFLSRVIRFVNWSIYSHAAWIDEQDGGVYEAWWPKVAKVKDLGTQHTPDTVVDLFTVETTPEQLNQIRKFMQSQVGKTYDLRSVIHFVSRRPQHHSDQQRWFCSELVFSAFASADIFLLRRISAEKVHPGLLAYSPLLTYFGTVATTLQGEWKMVDQAGAGGACGSPADAVPICVLGSRYV